MDKMEWGASVSETEIDQPHGGVQLSYNVLLKDGFTEFVLSIIIHTVIKSYIPTLLAAFCLCSCSTPSPSVIIPSAPEKSVKSISQAEAKKNKPNDHQSKAKRAIRSYLSDPGSAQFSGWESLVYGKFGYEVSVLANSKNRFGGYVGAMRYKVTFAGEKAFVLFGPDGKMNILKNGVIMR